jgi:UDP-glucose-4-epimerase GalE
VKVLVAGGAGYIGAHVVRALDAAGHEPLIVDDFRKSHPSRAGAYPAEAIALEDTRALTSAFERFRPDGVVHLGGYISVGESVREPGLYWENNLGAGASLLIAASRVPPKVLLFSSTAAVYGDAGSDPIPEGSPLRPTSPYGASKLAFERLLESAGEAAGYRTAALRYFNAAGANRNWGVGEAHDPEEHLVPRVIRMLRRGEKVTVYGNDYPTPDGTCVRDYVHVNDLASAHVAVLESALPSPVRFNVGTGRGASVLEVIREIGTQLGVIPVVDVLPRRPGDPPSLVADPTALRRAVDWTSRHSSLEEIIGSAIAWEKA